MSQPVRLGPLCDLSISTAVAAGERHGAADSYSVTSLILHCLHGAYDDVCHLLGCIAAFTDRYIIGHLASITLGNGRAARDAYNSSPIQTGITVEAFLMRHLWYYPRTRPEASPTEGHGSKTKRRNAIDVLSCGYETECRM